MKRARTRIRQMLRHKLRLKLIRSVFVLSVFALEMAWIILLCVGAFKIYDLIT